MLLRYIMRLTFKEGKQREMIYNEKQTYKLSFPQLAKKLDIKEGKLRAFYYDNLSIPEDIFNKFSLKEKYRKFIIEIRKDNWGRIKGGKLSKGSTKIVTTPEESEKLAEFIGIMLGDGNLTKIKGYKIGVYSIRIVGDSRFDRYYLINFVKPLIEELFEIKVNLYKIKKENGLNVNAYGLNLVNFLEEKGLKAGDKIRSQVTIPNWIKNNNLYLRACLRGLYDTDGSVYKLTNQNSHQISFRNYNYTLITDVRESLLSLGIKCSKISKGNEITITKKSELQKFLKEVGFDNLKHLNKVKMWNLAL